MAKEIKLDRSEMDAVQQKELDGEVLTWAELMSDDGALPAHEMGGDATGFVPRANEVADVFGEEGIRAADVKDRPVLHNAFGLTGVGLRKPHDYSLEELEDVARKMRQTGSFRSAEALRLTAVGSEGEPSFITDEVLKDVELAIADGQVGEPNVDGLVRMYEGNYGEPEDRYIELDGDFDSTSCSPHGELYRRTGKALPKSGLSQRELMKASRGKKDNSRISTNPRDKGELQRGRIEQRNYGMDRVNAKDFTKAKEIKIALVEHLLSVRSSLVDGGMLEDVAVTPTREESAWEDLLVNHGYRGGKNSASEPQRYFDERLLKVNSAPPREEDAWKRLIGSEGEAYNPGDRSAVTRNIKTRLQSGANIEPIKEPILTPRGLLE